MRVDRRVSFFGGESKLLEGAQLDKLSGFVNPGWTLLRFLFAISGLGIWVWGLGGSGFMAGGFDQTQTSARCTGTTAD